MRERPCFIMKVCLNMYPYTFLNGSLRIFYLRHVTSIQHVQMFNFFFFYQVFVKMLFIYLCIYLVIKDHSF